MLRVSVDRVTDEMTVAMPVHHPRQAGQVLVQGGFTLTQRIIERVRDLGITHIWVSSPDLSQVSRYVSPHVLAKREALAQHVGNAYAAAQASATFAMDYKAYAKQIEGMINELLANPKTVIYLDEMAGQNHTLADHCLRVSYLSVLMGIKLDAYMVQQRTRINARRAKEVTNLGLGAALHDIGKLKLDTQTMDRHLEGEDLPEVKQHVLVGYEMVQNQISPTATNIVLHHHQLYDGSGYPKIKQKQGEPQALSGEKIHVYARIVAVANAFDKLHFELYRRRKPVVAALQELLAPAQMARFDPRVVQALLQVVPPYAPGIELRLSDGSQATTIEHHPDDPCRPTVHRFNVPDDELEIDLRERADLHVVLADDQQVESFNFDPPALKPAPVY